ncbi:TonB-dependent receptor [Pseudomaricurvus alkylphenolicus]|uniref:TonB-dependent receptor domain-containing protein n=1 Tax=Pseudomaricurvus alkylphenolicus TaxID=1306991 RepID=UPI001422AA2A|nr:TonB-dependent receptor [Pseudomaricurvus alkylphenolicus]NIB41426.1 TonB-dependent receptor [Pseudomaricurvus alkylphenolicus]
MQTKKKLLSAHIAALTMSAVAGTAIAQNDKAVEEVVVVGNLRSAADDVVVERLESDVVSDIIDAEIIGKIGDSNLAAALRRVPGVTLIDDRFVFIRGLGERYSSSLLNGAQIPSPDLTRNVIPLDIFPTSILKSVSVQKGYSSDIPAAFSGGLIDIRTKGIPDDFTFSVEVGTSLNSETDGDVLSYSGGGDDAFGRDDGTRSMPGELRSALSTYQGSLAVGDILNDLNLSGNGNADVAEAEAINRNLALALNRNINVREESPDLNRAFELNVGNNFHLDHGMELGFLVGGSYESSWTNREIRDAEFGLPDDAFSERDVSTYNVSANANATVGWRWDDDHSVQMTALLLRNTDDKTTVRDYFGSSTPFSEGRGNRDYEVRYEERELQVLQFNGDHRFGGVVRETLGMEATRFDWLNDLRVEWFYSDSEVTTDIPNEVSVTYQLNVDGDGNFVSQNLQPSTSAGDFRFTNLQDEVENYGSKISLPLYFDNYELTLSGGYNYAKKARTYRQTEFALGTSDLAFSGNADGLPSDIFSDDNILDAGNGFEIDVVGNNGESYLAAVTNQAVFGEVDLRIGDAWRITAGLRWEDYKQVGLPWDPLDYDGCQVSCDGDDIAESVFSEDDYYPSVAFTYSTSDFGAETFQFRVNYSETIVRPDLREITPSSYIDPLTDAIVKGGTDVIPATVKNYDIRGEWFFSTGDNFTASLFYKDITDPIESFERAAFEDALAAQIINAESAELYGVEFEWLKGLGFLGEAFSPFFVSGNLTALDTEIVAGDRADSPTNPTRPLTGASDLTANIQFGFDSTDGQHSAMLVYNVFDERLFLAGRLGTPDAYEQPFHSLDLTYFWYPTEESTLRLRIKNILDEDVEIEQDGVTTFSYAPGSSFSIDYKWSF